MTDVISKNGLFCAISRLCRMSYDLMPLSYWSMSIRQCKCHRIGFNETIARNHGRGEHIGECSGIEDFSNSLHFVRIKFIDHREKHVICTLKLTLKLTHLPSKHTTIVCNN